MSRLALYLLGPPRVERDGVALKFRYRKHLALLAYLALAGPSPGSESHTRESLITLLWPELEPSRARAILRRDLSLLRKALDGEWLVVDREMVGLAPDADVWIDVDQFRQRLLACKTHAHPPTEACRECIPLLEEAAALYCDHFLAGFTLRDSAAFDEFQFFQTEGLKDQLAGALVRLTNYHASQEDFEPATSYARRWLALDPLHEPAHRRLMELYAQAGRHSAALRQYRTCLRALEEELGVPPSAETVALYEHIRAERTLPVKAEAATPIHPFPRTPLPAFLSAEEELVAVSRPVFVAREPDLERLDGYLEAALTGQGQVVFITGGPGRGKTALIREFGRRAMAAHRDLLVAMGNCNAYSGIGDPYLPFCEVMDMLTGDVEPRWAAGAITRDHAQHLWATVPLALQALVDHGPSLIDTLLPSGALLSRTAAAVPQGAGCLEELKALAERRKTGASGLEPGVLLAQYTRVLQALAAQHPLLLMVDDVQWADVESIGLFFHLGQRLADAGSRILIVGAYRPEEVAQGRGGARHPLEEVLTEFKRRFGDVWVDLAQVDASEGRRFVDAFLDSEPNRLGEVFRGILFQRTAGHPLFTVELLRAMAERGDLVQDADGRWTEGPSLDWQRLPAQVEAVIEARVGRLEEGQRELLAIASVEGEQFTAQVVAQVQDIPEREVLRALSQELGGRHRLVREGEEVQVDGRYLSRYQFAHALFQAYLRDTLSAGERRLLHGEVAMALEGLYGGQTDEIVVQLAHHYAEAGHREKTLEYSQRAGEQAVRKSANVEAIGYFRRALELLETLPDTPERDQQELTLQLALGAPLITTQGYGAPEVGHTYTRARELCQQMSETPQVFPALYALGTFYASRGELQTAREIGEQMLGLAQSAEDPLNVAVAQDLLGWLLPHLGGFALGQAYLEQVITFYDPQQHASLAFLYGHDLGMHSLAYAAHWWWALGYPDQALKRSEESIALAQKLDHSHTLCAALGLSAWLRTLRREARAARLVDEMCIRVATEEGFTLWVNGSGCRGWVLSEEGRSDEGIALFLQEVVAEEAIGFTMYRPQRLGYLAEMYRKAGRVEEGLAAATESLAVVEQTGNRYYEVETHRLKGELLLMRGDEAEAESSFHKAIEVARRQQTKSWELRATVSLCRLWREQGKREEARQMLAEIYGWFTEGLDTLDLKEAKALLDELSLTLNGR